MLNSIAVGEDDNEEAAISVDGTSSCIFFFFLTHFHLRSCEPLHQIVGDSCRMLAIPCWWFFVIVGTMMVFFSLMLLH